MCIVSVEDFRYTFVWMHLWLLRENVVVTTVDELAVKMFHLNDVTLDRVNRSDGFATM